MNNNLLIDSNNYEFNIGNKRGIYIIHGFTNSTYEIKTLAQFLAKQGYYIRADNLPGHGTTPKDCNRFKFQDWIKHVEQGFAEMSVHCEQVFVIGISMGSVLAMYLSSLFPIDGAIYASIALKFQQKIGMHFLTPIFHNFISYRSKYHSYPSNLQKKLNFLGYKVWPLSALNEVRKLTKVVRPKLVKITCPALLIHSKADALTLEENVDFAYKSISSKNKEIFRLENAGHNIFIDNPDQQIIFQKITSFLNKLN